MGSAAIAMGSLIEVELRRSGLQNFDLGMPAERRATLTVYLPRLSATPQPQHYHLRREGLKVLPLDFHTGNMGSPLEGCVGSLRNSMQLLDSSINILAEGVNDFPRLAKVLQTTRVRATHMD